MRGSSKGSGNFRLLVKVMLSVTMKINYFNSENLPIYGWSTQWISEESGVYIRDNLEGYKRELMTKTDKLNVAIQVAILRYVP